MFTTHESSFVVFPEHANHHSPLIFGGKFAAELDLAAANCVRKFLFDSTEVSHAVTHRMEIEFKKPCYVGDLLCLHAEIVEAKDKHVVVNVIAQRARKNKDWDIIAIAKFVFITVEDLSLSVGSKPDFLPYKSHGMLW